jgi:Calx-beta domain-containing protein/WD40 repeat protein
MKTHLFWKFFKSLPIMALVGFGVLGIQNSQAQAQVLSLPSLVSINSSGSGSGNNNSDAPVVTPDGRFIVFDSFASDLTTLADNNNDDDIFERDLQAGTTTLVSVNSSGTATGNGLSGFQSVTPDGRFVAFASDATDLVPNDSNAHRDIFVRDLQAGTTTLVSINNGGTNGGNGDSRVPVISADGRFVAFESDASDLVATDGNGATDIFLRDLQAGTTTLVSINLSGTDSGNGSSLKPAITPDGRFVGFYGSANDLVSNDSGTTFDVFVRDMQAGTTAMVSVNNTGTGGGNASSAYPALSSDGRFVAFLSDSNNLGTLPISGNPQNVFVRDLQGGTTILVSVNSSGTTAGSLGSGDAGPPMMSPDGRFIAFESFADDLVTNDTNGSEDVFLRDLQAGTTTLVSVNGSGVSGNNDSQSPVLSADGRFVAFSSNADDLAPNDGNGAVDVFVRDMTAGVTSLVSRNSSGTGSGNNGSSSPVISADGSTITFEADASDLVSNDTNGNTTDVFVVFQPGQVQFSAATYSVNESGGTATITVTRTGGTGGVVTVDFATSDGTATATQDYTPASGTLTFNPGVTSQTFTVPILNDTLDESDETVNLTLSNPTGGATLGTPGQAVLTIIDDDAEICDNGIDDDGDGLIDCADPDCAGSPTCGDLESGGCRLGDGSNGSGNLAAFLLPILAVTAMAVRRRRS